MMFSTFECPFRALFFYHIMSQNHKACVLYLERSQSMTALEFKNNILPTYGAMLALACQILASQEDAADVVQDVMRSLWERHKDIELPDSIYGFVFRCTRNRCIDFLRREKNISSLDEMYKNTIEDNTEDTVFFTERLKLVMMHIKLLDPQRRTVMLLSMKGASTAQIANHTGISETNVRQILSRTRRQIRNLVLEKETNNL